MSRGRAVASPCGCGSRSSSRSATSGPCEWIGVLRVGRVVMVRVILYLRWLLSVLE